MSLKSIVEDSDTRMGRIFDLSMMVLIVVSLLSFSIETLPGLSPGLRHILEISEVGIVLIFTAEYILRIVVADKKLAFVFSFYGIIDLLAIAPFYLASGVDLRSVRAFRLLRLIRIFKVLRYGQAVRRFRTAFQIAKEEIVLFMIVTIILLWLSAVGIYYFEHDAQPEEFATVLHSLWWAVTTLSSVGYGDVYPITLGGRLFTFFVLMIGLGIVAVPAGLIASSLAKVRQDESKDTESK